jgi:REP element-mobilizing transposase RayT
MPSQLKRFYDTADLHFVTFSCYHRQPNLSLPPNRDLFFSVIEQIRRRYQFDIIGYVVMPEHVHLLLSKPEQADLSVVIQVLKQAVSRKSSAPAVFGNADSITSTCGPKQSEKKNSAICIRTLSPEDW